MVMQDYEYPGIFSRGANLEAASNRTSGSRLSPGRRDVTMLEIRNLHARLEDGREILNGIDLSVGDGEVHAIMGPNGSGKSTLAAVRAGRAGYEITQGSGGYHGRARWDLPPDERAR